MVGGPADLSAAAGFAVTVLAAGTGAGAGALVVAAGGAMVMVIGGGTAGGVDVSCPKAAGASKLDMVSPINVNSSLI